MHEGGWRLRYDADADIAEFVDPRGHVRYDARPRTPTPLFGETLAVHGRRPASNGAGAEDKAAADDAGGSGDGAGPEDVGSEGASAGAAEDVPSPAAAADVTTGVRAAEALAERNRKRGVNPDGERLRARYRREADIPWDVLAPALEALDEAHFGG